VNQVAVSMHALQLGALALLPDPRWSATSTSDEMARQFTSSIRAMAAFVSCGAGALPQSGALPYLVPALATKTKPVELIAIAGFAGGPGALHSDLLRAAGRPAGSDSRRATHRAWLRRKDCAFARRLFEAARQSRDSERTSAAGRGLQVAPGTNASRIARSAYRRHHRRPAVARLFGPRGRSYFNRSPTLGQERARSGAHGNGG